MLTNDKEEMFCLQWVEDTVGEGHLKDKKHLQVISIFRAIPSVSFIALPVSKSCWAWQIIWGTAWFCYEKIQLPLLVSPISQIKNYIDWAQVSYLLFTKATEMGYMFAGWRKLPSTGGWVFKTNHKCKRHVVKTYAKISVSREFEEDSDLICSRVIVLRT